MLEMDPQTIPANFHHYENQHDLNCYCFHQHDHHHLLSSDTITIIASFLPISDWFSMSAVNECWFQAMHHGMNNEWKRVYEKVWRLNRIIDHSDHEKVLNVEKTNIEKKKFSDDEDYEEENNDHDDDNGGDEEDTTDWMRVIQHYLNKLPIKIETVERGECLDFCEERFQRMEWSSPILKSRKAEEESTFSIFQFSFHILKRLKESIENFTSLDDHLETIQLALFKEYRVCLFLEYLSLGLRPSVISDLVYVWEDIYDLEPILTLPLVSFLFILHSENPIELMEDFIQDEYGEVSNWIYVSLSQCPQNRIGFSFIVKELDSTNFSYDWNGKLPWYHQTDINNNNFPLYLGYSQHLLDDESSYDDNYDCSSPCRVYHLSISCELLETHHIKLYREEKVL